MEIKDWELLIKTSANGSELLTNGSGLEDYWMRNTDLGWGKIIMQMPTVYELQENVLTLMSAPMLELFTKKKCHISDTIYHNKKKGQSL